MGEHSTEQSNASDSTTSNGPLANLTILDLTRVLAGPFCTMVLCDLGARVIKVERPQTGDDARSYGPFVEGNSTYFASLNRGKQSIALDLKAPEDVEIFHQLVSISDVLVENFRPGTMEKLGLGWDDLKERYPSLIYAAASGFGHTGPQSKRAAYDMVVQGMGGIMSVTGHPGQPPVRVGTSIGDITAGLFTAIGITSALLHRSATGKGTKVDVSMLDCQVAILENCIARYVATGEVAGPIGTRHPAITPFAAFGAEDDWVIIAAGNDTLFEKLCKEIECEELVSDERFKSNHARTENWQELFALINEKISHRTAAEWFARLDQAGIPCGPINSIDKVLSNDQVLARNMVIKTAADHRAPLEMAGNPIKLADFEDPNTRPAAPELDADREEITAELEALPQTALTSTEQDRQVVPSDTVSRFSSSSFLHSSLSLPTLRYLDQFSRVFLQKADYPAIAEDKEPFLRKAQKLADALLSEQGEVLGTAIAVDFANTIAKADDQQRLTFLNLLARDYGPDANALEILADTWKQDRSDKALIKLAQAVEAPRQELFRRTNMAPGGTAVLVDLRKTLLAHMRSQPELKAVDADLKHLFGSWFNRGFLELRRIDWHTPAAILEKLIAYEAVHEIQGWEDLRRRLARDRRCFAYFHPQLPNEPLIFVEVALVSEISSRIEPIIRTPPSSRNVEAADTAIFYSISNCQPGLRGIAFGNLLIKQVANELSRELPQIKTFSTLSPIPTLRRYVEKPDTDLGQLIESGMAADVMSATGTLDVKQAVSVLSEQVEKEGYSSNAAELLKDLLLPICARFLAGFDNPSGPSDPVSRFHLGNGASIERVNWAADLSSKGRKQSYGLMVNYLYDLSAIETNHEAFANNRPIACSNEVRELLGDKEQRNLLAVARNIMGRSLP